MSAVLWSLLALPTGAGAVLAGAGVGAAGTRAAGTGRTAADRAAPAVASLVAAATLGLAVLAAVGRPTADAGFLPGIPAGLAVDDLSAVLVVTVAATTLAVLLFSAAEFPATRPRARYAGLILIFAGAMLVTVTATNLAVLLIGWEVMGAVSYALIAYDWRDRAAVDAGGTAFLTTRAADLGLYLAAGGALAGTGSLSLTALPGAGQPWLALVTAGVVVAAVGKSAQLPLSYWLSAAMRGPSGVSALLHSATMVAAGGYLLLRLVPLLTTSGAGAVSVAWLGAATAVLLGAVAVAQTDLKQLLAASTAAQLGLVVLAAGVTAPAGGAGQLVAHAAVKSLLFLSAGAWLVALGTRELPDLAGAARRYPVVGAAFTVGAVALAGLPPLPLWTTKDLILAGARQEQLALYLAGLAASVLSALYAGRALAVVWRPAPARPGYDRERVGTRRVDRPGRSVPAVLAVVTLLLALPAVTPLPELYGLKPSLGGGPAVTPAHVVVATVPVVAAFAAALWWGPRPVPAPGWLRGWLRLRPAVTAAVVRPTLATAAALARFDQRGPATAVRYAAEGTRGFAGLVRDHGEHRLETAVAAVAAGARWLGRTARRPQTGQPHAYFAQAVAGLLATAGLLVLLLLTTAW